jgi:hypothetical protein
MTRESDARQPSWRALLASGCVLRGPWLPWEHAFTIASGGIVLTGCADVMAEECQVSGLAKQRERGWSVGNEDMPLFLPNATDLDVTGTESWRRLVWTLPDAMAPTSARWAPYYARTLFQVLQNPRSADLRAFLRPIATPSMALAYRRGTALASLFAGAGGCRNDVAVVLDASGPESVAAAAALAYCLEPVFFFDNWPHPAGVVPSHRTLASALYYSPHFERMRLNRNGNAAPVVVLDRARLASYTDEVARFDNRYVARVPFAGALAAAGIHHLLYVTGEAASPIESDDLNEDFVALAKSGIAVRMVALDAFMPEAHKETLSELADPQTQSALEGLSFDGTRASSTANGPQLLFAGSQVMHSSFWSWYGWPDQNGQPPRALSAQDLAAIPPSLLPDWAYRPSERPTMFSGEPCTDEERPEPEGHMGGGFGFSFGTGHATGFRSGSFGRVGGGHPSG